MFMYGDDELRPVLERDEVFCTVSGKIPPCAELSIWAVWKIEAKKACGSLC